MNRRVFVRMAILALLGAAPLEAQRAPALPPRADLMNLNTATEMQLATLPGIGPKTASLIAEYRQKSGGFKKIEELMNVRGLGEKSFLKIKDLITVTAPARGGAARE